MLLKMKEQKDQRNLSKQNKKLSDEEKLKRKKLQKETLSAPKDKDAPK